MKFRLLAADPPWKFGDALPGKGRGAEKHYACMGTGAICGFEIPPVADDAILLLWRVAAMPDESLMVARAWGFRPMGELVWVKTNEDQSKLSFGMGRVFRAAHETCLVATRGAYQDVVMEHGLRSVFFAPRGRHSAKPDEFYRLAELLTPGPRAELFARKRRPGWTQFGDQLGAPLELEFQGPEES